MKTNQTGNEPADEPNIPASGMGAPPVSRGKKIERHLDQDDLTTERMVRQGADEAEEDSTAEAKRTGTRSEG